MSDVVGPINFSDGEETLFLGREVTKTKSHSEETSLIIDQEIRKVLMECHKRAEILIKDHKPEMERLTEGLLKHEVLSRAQVDALIGGDTPPEPEAEDEPDPEIETPAAAAEETPPEAEESPSDDDLESEGRFAY